MSVKLKRTIEYIPPEPTRTLVQVRIENDLRERVNRQREKDGLSWQQLIEACLRRYLDERVGA